MKTLRLTDRNFSLLIDVLKRNLWDYEQDNDPIDPDPYLGEFVTEVNELEYVIGTIEFSMQQQFGRYSPDQNPYEDMNHSSNVVQLHPKP